METCLSKKSCCVQPGGGPKNQKQCTWNAMRSIKKHCNDWNDFSSSEKFEVAFTFYNVKCSAKKAVFAGTILLLVCSTLNPAIHCSKILANCQNSASLPNSTRYTYV